MNTAEPVTELLIRWRAGDSQALERLLSIVYGELHQIADHYLRHERSGHTLQTTALVHEAYLRLVGEREIEWQNRAHFFAIAAKRMRHILVEHARARAAEKRGGGQYNISLSKVDRCTSRSENVDLLALDEALARLQEMDEQKSRVVELRYFGGLSIKETAEVLGVSPATVKRDWSVARAWLRKEIGGR